HTAIARMSAVTDPLLAKPALSLSTVSTSQPIDRPSRRSRLYRSRPCRPPVKELRYEIGINEAFKKLP
ncbi:MAG: hypothetical protein LBR92_04655, partial [Puniceicoccales bacterium]|nr:hypothetical protein [Puniceicoccales bacterium]